MNFKLERLSDSKVKINYVVSKDEFNEALDHAFNKVIKDVEMRGFRKGKVPREIYLKKYGEESLYEEAINYAINNSYPEGLLASNLEVVSEPEFDIDFESLGSDSEFKYSVTLEVWPEVKLGQYKGLEVTKEDDTVSDEEVDAFINQILDSKAEMVLVEEGALAEGHLAIIDFEGFLNGVAFEGGKGENYSLEIGSNTFIPGFEEQLLGMKTGEERTINVTFPEDYPAEELKGQQTEFKVKLHEIKLRVVPELTDEIVEDLDVEGISTAEEYRQSILDKLVSEKQIMVDNKLLDDLIKQVCKNAETEIPAGLINDELDAAVSQLEAQAAQYNLTAEQLLSFNNLTIEDYKEQMKEAAETRVLERIVLRKIYETENFEFSDEEINEQYHDLAEAYKRDIEEIKMLIPEHQIKAHLGILKSIELIKDSAVIKEEE